jgi:hypothetical protein
MKSAAFNLNQGSLSLNGRGNIPSVNRSKPVVNMSANNGFRPASNSVKLNSGDPEFTITMNADYVNQRNPVPQVSQIDSSS